jgi:nucleotide-binding universal stress UspA family protein
MPEKQSQGAKPMKRVLVCLDGSVYARSVCDHAAWIAGRLEASAELLHVVDIRSGVPEKRQDLSGNIGIDTLDHLMSEMVDQDHARSRTAQQAGRHLLDSGRAILKEAGIDDTSATLRNGAVVDAVHDLSVRADLIVLGKRGEGADFALGHLGSNLERVVRAIDRPCLVAARSFKPIERILIAFDGGKSARRAVGYLASSPAFKDLEIRLILASERPEDSAVTAALAWAEKELATAGLKADCRIVEGEAEEVIANAVASDGIDLLIMGAYGHSRIRNLIIGSTTTAMIRDCKVPVLLFR